jgi:DnaJ-class molecular chaperone
VLNHYDVLGVEPTADIETIRRAWRIKVRLLHPDKHQGSPSDVQAEAASETLRATVAWETLRDPDKRRAYDRTVRVETNSRGNGTGTANGAGTANGKGNTNGFARAHRAQQTQTVDGDAELRVTCLLCSTTQHIPVAAGRFECTGCREAWQLAKCETCDKISQIRERRTDWRCGSCSRQQRATWGGSARRVFCTRCKAGTEVGPGVDRFRCAGCGLQHLRCSCGQYRTFPVLPWLTWRCPRCQRLNQISERNALAVGQFLVLVGALILVVIGVVLLAGLLR